MTICVIVYIEAGGLEEIQNGLFIGFHMNFRAQKSIPGDLTWAGLINNQIEAKLGKKC